MPVMEPLLHVLSRTFAGTSDVMVGGKKRPSWTNAQRTAMRALTLRLSRRAGRAAHAADVTRMTH